MLEELGVAAALVVGADAVLILRGRGSVLIREMGQAPARVASWSASAYVHAVESNPLTRLATVLVLLVCTGWAATVSQIGSAEAGRAIRFQRPAAVGSARCHRIQEDAVRVVPEMAAVLDVHLTPGPLDPSLGFGCPDGGAYAIDDVGELVCSEHGRARGTFPLIDMRVASAP